MAQRVRSLLYKPDDPSLSPRGHVKSRMCLYTSLITVLLLEDGRLKWEGHGPARLTYTVQQKQQDGLAPIRWKERTSS